MLIKKLNGKALSPFVLRGMAGIMIQRWRFKYIQVLVQRHYKHSHATYIATLGDAVALRTAKYYIINDN